MAYFADTHAASGTPGADMAAIIKTALTSVSGWSFIETYTNGGHVCDVYKSAAAAVHGDTVTLGGKTYVQMASQLFVDNSV